MQALNKLARWLLVVLGLIFACSWWELPHLSFYWMFLLLLLLLLYFDMNLPMRKCVLTSQMYSKPLNVLENALPTPDDAICLLLCQLCIIIVSLPLLPLFLFLKLITSKLTCNEYITQIGIPVLCMFVKRISPQFQENAKWKKNDIATSNATEVYTVTNTLQIRLQLHANEYEFPVSGCK